MTTEKEGRDSGETYVHIFAPRERYLARVRRLGHRKYDLVGKPTRDEGLAIRRMAKAFTSGSYKRGDVIAISDNPYLGFRTVLSIKR